MRRGKENGIEFVSFDVFLFGNTEIADAEIQLLTILYHTIPYPASSLPESQFRFGNKRSHIKYLRKYVDVVDGSDEVYE